MKKTIFFTLLILIGMPFASAVELLSVTPLIADYKSEPRGIIGDSLILTNQINRKLTIYAFVHNLSSTDGLLKFIDSAFANKESSLANWISISRGVIEILPNQQKKIDFSINVNPQAKPGIYHALISFVDASNRYEAETKIHQAPNLTVNLEVLDDAVEGLQLKKFGPKSNFLFSGPVNILYQLENIGDKSLTPAGDIIIYNRRGEEVAMSEVNTESFTIEPRERKELASLFRGFKGYGRYRASLSVNYGNIGRTLQDTVFFWIIPWKKILTIFLGTLLILSTFVIIIRRYHAKNHS